MEYKYKVEGPETDELYKAFLKLKTVEECYRFFEDLCTINEINAFGQRLSVAKLIDQKVTYQEIENRTGVSAATISKISKSYAYGPSGYKMVIDRLKK
ncbi:MAG: YerC/YecD family TrpR-related protein [Candidatus Izemoplasma sp.]